MSIRRLGLAIVMVVAGVVVSAAPTVAAPGGGECQLQGTANLAPPLSASSADFTYSFSGALSGCQSNVTGAPASGNVTAGTQLPETVTLTNSLGQTQQGTVQYQLPVPTGNGSCGNSTTAGKSLTTWANGKHTVVDYTTNGAAAAVVLQGTVVPSVTATLVASSVPAGWTAPSSFTIATDEPSFPAGEGALAALSFSPTTQDQDCVNVGVSAAAINGVVGIGSTG